jgi:hypothetical protein
MKPTQRKVEPNVEKEGLMRTLDLPCPKPGLTLGLSISGPKMSLFI